MKRCIKLASSVLFATGLFITNLSGANLLLNSGFETPDISPSMFQTLGNGSTFITNWEVTGDTCGGNCVLMLDTAYTEPSLSFPAHSGDQAIDMTGSGNTFNGGIQQLVNLTPGSMYQLSFWLGNQDNAFTANYGLASSVEVFVNGSSIGTGTNNLSTPNTVNWQQITFFFTPTVAANTILFKNATAPGDNMAGLDDVYLDLASGAVPEPATIGLVGAAIVGLALRQTRRSA